MQYTPYTLGIDVGIASVGAALIAPESEQKILAMYVRTFDAAEHPKTGESLNLVRREARSVRRRLRRRAHRLLRLRRLFKRVGLELPPEPATKASILSPWQLRAEGLDRVLQPVEWSAVLIHLIKHRGFQSNRKSQLKDDEDTGKMLSSMNANHERMDEKGYRTVGEMIWKDEAFADAKRNKDKSYKNTLGRKDIEQELEQLFQQQKAFGNTFSDDPLYEAVHELLMARRPTVSGDQIEKMVGRCSFEVDQLRAPKAAISSERFVWLGKLLNLKIQLPESQRALTPSEFQQLKDLPFSLTGKSRKVTFTALRKQLDLPIEARFNLVSYKLEADDKKAEGKACFEAKAFHTLRLAYEKHGLTHEWQQNSQDHTKLDQIAEVISLYRDDDLIRPKLAEAGLSEDEVEAVLDCQFEGFGHLSLKVLRAILPFMEQGQRYDEAMKSAGYDHSNTTVPGIKSGRIPAPDKEKIRNPVVLRSLNQARRLINAIIEKHGSPLAINIELARNLSSPKSERDSISKEQDKYRKIKELVSEEFEEQFARPPSALELVKFRLYKEQDGICGYSLKPLELNRLIEEGYLEVDHILPYSRSYDDSLNNKTLVLTGENRDKGNRTPWEFMGEDEESPRWQRFRAQIIGNKKIRLAKRNRYLRKDFGKEASLGFRERHLNDTRYIGRELKRMIEQHIEWYSDSESSETDKADRCRVLSGQLTAFLRTRWGFNKVRSDGDMHHAIDAAVIASATTSMIQRLALHSKYHELKNVRQSYINPETGEVTDLRAARALEKHFPLPWDHFKLDVLDMRNPHPANHPDWPGVRVSRASTKRKRGAAHQETIRSKGKDNYLLNEGRSSVKTPLTKLNKINFKDIAGFDDPRNARLIALLQERLEAFDWKGDRAFAANQPPVYKPAAEGKQPPIVRSVRLCATQKSGFSVRDGIANNDTMVRVDIFSKQKRLYAVPVYLADTIAPELPSKAILANKPETEWPEMDASYEFLFSLHNNDWVEVTLKAKKFSGYFSAIDRSTGAISLWSHDRNSSVGKDGLYRGIGIKTALRLEKFHVDWLGDLYPAKSEKRKEYRKNGKEQ